MSAASLMALHRGLQQPPAPESLAVSPQTLARHDGVKTAALQRGCNSCGASHHRSCLPTDLRHLPLLQRVIIYPSYIDNRKTVAQGRRIPREQGTCDCLTVALSSSVAVPTVVCPCAAACEAPNAIEIYECIINGLKLEAEAEVCIRNGCASHTPCSRLSALSSASGCLRHR